MKILYDHLFMFLVMLSVCFAFEAQGQSPFHNGDFELSSLPPGAEPVGYYYRALNPGDTNISGWVTTAGYHPAVAAGPIEYIKGFFQDPLQNLGGHIELGFYYTFSGIQQTFSTVPNQSYTVNFYLASNPLNLDAGPAILRVDVDGIFSDYAAAPGSGNEQNLGWQLRQFDFVAGNTGTTTLQFWNIQGIAAIDGVAVVPEPQSGMLVSFALAGFLGLRLKRKHVGRSAGRG